MTLKGAANTFIGFPKNWKNTTATNAVIAKQRLMSPVTSPLTTTGPKKRWQKIQPIPGGFGNTQGRTTSFTPSDR